MKKIYKKFGVLIVLCVCMLMAVVGCSSHRKTDVYNTTGEINTETISYDELNENEEDITDSLEDDSDERPEFKFTINDWINSMINNGYIEKTSIIDGVEEVSFDDGDCKVGLAVVDDRDSKCRRFNITIAKNNYDEVQADKNIKDAYLNIIKCIIELQGDLFSEDMVWNFITTSSTLDGDYYNLSDNIMAYSQIYMGKIEIVICPRWE